MSNRFLISNYKVKCARVGKGKRLRLYIICNTVFIFELIYTQWIPIFCFFECHFLKKAEVSGTRNYFLIKINSALFEFFDRKYVYTVTT
jgi:hypothetical protein